MTIKQHLYGSRITDRERLIYLTVYAPASFLLAISNFKLFYTLFCTVVISSFVIYHVQYEQRRPPLPPSGLNGLIYDRWYSLLHYDLILINMLTSLPLWVQTLCMLSFNSGCRVQQKFLQCFSLTFTVFLIDLHSCCGWISSSILTNLLTWCI